MRGAASIEILHDYLAGSGPMLNDAQRAIDDGLELAAIVAQIAERGENAEFGVTQERAVAIARGMMGGELARLASYLTDSAMKDGQPTRAGLLRSVSGIYDRPEPS